MFCKFFVYALAIGWLASAKALESEDWQCEDGGIISMEYLCDDYFDCNDGSDESKDNCGHRQCPDDEFKCDNTRCIHIGFRCDGEVDCQDGDESDEYGCDAIVEVEGCFGSDFQCPNTSVCFPGSWKCDREVDCKDGSDEFECPCPHGVHKCDVIGRTICLDEWALCDGVKHCDDGTDEEGCIWDNTHQWECPPNTFRCVKVSECIPLINVCDGQVHCTDKSDEGGLCHADSCVQNSTENMMEHEKACNGFCTQTSTGAQCSCMSGFMLDADKSTCVDINECDNDGMVLSSDASIKDEKWCSQRCHNTVGSFACGCDPGYELDVNGFHCKATGVTPPKLYFAADNQMRELTLRGSLGIPTEETKLYASQIESETITSIAFHSEYQLLFWAEGKAQKIKMLNQYGEVKDVVNEEGGFEPVSVTVDWLGQGLFYSSIKSNSDGSKSGKISVVKIQLTKPFERSVEVLSNLSDPVAITMCPHKGLLIVADRGTTGFQQFNPEIFTTNADGSNRKTLVKADLLPPTAVAFEHVHRTLYWASNGLHSAKVERINIDGSNRMVLLAQQSRSLVARPWSLSLFEGNVYLADRNKQEIEVWEEARQSAKHEDAEMRSKPVIKLSKMTRMTALTIAHPVLQTGLESANPCESKMCSSVCVILLQEFGFSLFKRKVPTAKCLCPSGMKLTDERTCVETAVPVPLVDNTSVVTPKTPTATPTTTSPTTTTSTTTSTPTTTIQPRPSNTLPKPTPCPFPGIVPHASIHPSRMSSKVNSTFGAGVRIVYKCHKGYKVKDTHEHMRTLVCLSTGKWNGITPVCVHAVGDSTTLFTNDDPCQKLVCGENQECKISKGKTGQCMCSYGVDDKTTLCLTKEAHALLIASKTTSKRMNPKVIASIVVLLTMLTVSAAVVCKCYKRRLTRSTLNVGYTRGSIMKGVAQRRTGCVHDSSISNPNYVSPAKHGRRILNVDARDSGLDRTSSSSISSLEDSMHPQVRQQLMADFSDMQEGASTSTGRGLASQLATIFNLRKSESREAMIPK